MTLCDSCMAAPCGGTPDSETYCKSRQSRALMVLELIQDIADDYDDERLKTQHVARCNVFGLRYEDIHFSDVVMALIRDREAE